MKEIEPHEQLTTYSCGSAALTVAYRALGIECNEANILVELETGKNGVEWVNLVNHASNMGFPIELKLRATYKDIQKDFKRGVIITGFNTNCMGELFSHACVVSGVLDDYIELTDPGQPEEDWPTIMTREDFIANWAVNGEAQGYLLIKPKT